MQECAPGDKGGAAIGFAKMRFAIFLINHCNKKIAMAASRPEDFAVFNSQKSIVNENQME